MAYKFGLRSKSRLETCNDNIQRLFNAVIGLGIIDMTVIEGRRDRNTQDGYFHTGFSKVPWPESKHNVKNPNDLADAVDVAPYVNGEVSWKKEHCIFLAGLVMATAKALNIEIRWGGNWDRDGEPITDQDFQDLVHFEEVKGE